MVRVAAKQRLGSRDNQEDAFQLVFQNEQDLSSDILMILSDGMGGHAGGEVASNLACKVFADHFVKRSQAPGPRKRLGESLGAANMAIQEKIRADPALRGMGCTLIGALKMENRLSWISVGDSILFVLRQGKLRRLNADHSLYGELNELVKQGKMSQREADTNPRRNALRAAVMGEEIALIDLESVDLVKGDLIVLATDGLETLSDEEIKAILVAEKRPDVRSLCSDLLNAVETKVKANQDNTSVIVYRHTSNGRTSISGQTKWSSLSESPGKKGMIGKLWLVLGAVITVAFIGALALLWALGAGDEPVVPPVPKPPVTQPSDTENRVLEGEGRSGSGDTSIIEEPPQPDVVVPEGDTGTLPPAEPIEPNPADTEPTPTDPVVPEAEPDAIDGTGPAEGSDTGTENQDETDARRFGETSTLRLTVLGAVDMHRRRI